MRKRGGCIAIPAIADISVFQKQSATKQHPATAYKKPAKYRKIRAYRILRRSKNTHKNPNKNKARRLNFFPLAKVGNTPLNLLKTRRKNTHRQLKTCPCYKGIVTYNKYRPWLFWMIKNLSLLQRDCDNWHRPNPKSIAIKNLSLLQRDCDPVIAQP